MAVVSAGRIGDQVALTSQLQQFQQPACLTFDFLLDESKPGNSGTLSVYLLSKHRFPTPLRLNQGTTTSNGGWKRGSVYIPSGTYHVMFLATIGQPYRSDIYIDNVELGSACYDPHSIDPTGNFISK